MIDYQCFAIKGSDAIRDLIIMDFGVLIIPCKYFGCANQ
jgi:hypothetical protein